MIAEKQTVPQMLQSIRALSPREQLDLLEQIASMIRVALPSQPARSVLELEGLGAHIWRGVRTQEYVNEERAAWDG